jgi:hypothetical protein
LEPPVTSDETSERCIACRSKYLRDYSGHHLGLSSS